MSTTSLAPQPSFAETTAEITPETALAVNKGLITIDPEGNTSVAKVRPDHVAELTVSDSFLAREVALALTNDPETILQYGIMAGHLPYSETPETRFSKNKIAGVADTQKPSDEYMQAYFAREKIDTSRLDPEIINRIAERLGHPINSRRMEQEFPGIESLSDEAVINILDTVGGNLAIVVKELHKNYSATREGARNERLRELILKDRQGKDVNLSETLLIVLCKISAGDQDFFSPQKRFFADLKSKFGVEIDLTDLQTIVEAHTVATEILGASCDIEEGNGCKYPELVKNPHWPLKQQEHDLFLELNKHLLTQLRNLEVIYGVREGKYSLVNAVKAIAALQRRFPPEFIEKRLRTNEDKKSGRNGTGAVVALEATGRSAKIERVARALANSEQTSGSDAAVMALLQALGERDMRTFQEGHWTARDSGDPSVAWEVSEIQDFMNSGE